MIGVGLGVLTMVLALSGGAYLLGRSGSAEGDRSTAGQPAPADTAPAGPATPSTDIAPAPSNPGTEPSAPASTSAGSEPETTGTEGNEAPADSDPGSGTSEGPDGTSGDVEEEVQGDAVDTLPAGMWVTVFDSLEKSKYTELEAAREAESLQLSWGSPHRVHVLDSDALSGLNGGYWALAVIDGTSRDDAVGICEDFGRSAGGSCYPRQIG